MDSRVYWEGRAAREMYEEMELAERANGEINRLLHKAEKHLRFNGEGIFALFRHDTGLTEQEARLYLAGVQGRDIGAFLAVAEQIRDPEKRRRLIKWIRSHEPSLYKMLELREQVDRLTPILYAAEKSIFERCLTAIITRAIYRKVFEIQRQVGVAWRISPVEARRVEAIMSRPWLGSNYSSRLWTNAQALAEKVKEEIVVSWITGKTEHDSWKAIEAQFGNGEHEAHRLIRTEAAHAANTAQMQAYLDAGVDRYIFVATLDMKTSDICRREDGKVYYVKDAIPGTNCPPMHPWCRSTTVAYLPPELRQHMTRIARDPVTGKNYKIPATMTYGEWYREYVTGGNHEA